MRKCKICSSSLVAAIKMVFRSASIPRLESTSKTLGSFQLPPMKKLNHKSSLAQVTVLSELLI